MFKRSKSEEGQAIVVLVLAMVVLILFAALAIDGGNIYTNRRIVQNTSDAAAMAGTQKLIELCSQTPPSNDWTQIRDTVAKYVAANGGAASVRDASGNWGLGTKYSIYYVDSQGNRLNGNLTIDAVGGVPCGCYNGQSVGYQATGVEVKVDKTFGGYFMGLLGRSQMVASAGAKANYGVTKPTSVLHLNALDVYPIAVAEDRVPASAEGQPTITFFNADSNKEPTTGSNVGINLPGGFGWLSWFNTNSAPDLDKSLGMGNSPTFSPWPGYTVNQYVSPDPDKAPPLTAGKRVAGSPGLKNGSVEQLYGRTIILPVYDTDPQATNGQGSHVNYMITGFVGVQIQEYHKQGQQSWMTAKVVSVPAETEWDTTVSTCSVPLFHSEKITH